MLLRDEKKLREAAANNNVEEFVSLLSGGQVDVNCEVDALKTTPLEQAASRGLKDRAQPNLGFIVLAKSESLVMEHAYCTGYIHSRIQLYLAKYSLFVQIFPVWLNTSFFGGGSTRQCI